MPTHSTIASSLPSGSAEPSSAQNNAPHTAAQTPEHEQVSTARLYQQQRQRAQRTAWKVGVVAVLVYVGFILTGVIGR